MEAKIEIARQAIFDLVQRVQQPNNDFEKSVQEIKALDEDTNTYVIDCQKIKDRSVRKELLQSVGELKSQIRQGIESLSNIAK